MGFLTYGFRAFIMFLVTWLGVRLLGKKTVAQMTSYDFAAVLLLTTTAAEPLVYKIPSKAAYGVLVIACLAVFMGRLSLKKLFYNADQKPSIVIVNGKIDKKVLKQNEMNIPLLLSQLRIAGYARVSDIEFGIIEPSGSLSVIPKSQNRAVTPNDLKLETKYEGLALPLVLDGEIQYQNLHYAKLDVTWLKNELKKQGDITPEDVFLAELDSQGKLYIDIYDKATEKMAPPII